MSLKVKVIGQRSRSYAWNTWFFRIFRGVDHTTHCTHTYTLFSKRSAHWFHPVLPVTQGDVKFVKMVFGVICKRPRLKIPYGSLALLRHGVFCELLSRPFDKIKMTRGRGRWPSDFRKLGWFSHARHSETSVFLIGLIETMHFFLEKLILWVPLLIQKNKLGQSLYILRSRVLRHVGIVSDKKRTAFQLLFLFFFLQHAKKKGFF